MDHVANIQMQRTSQSVTPHYVDEQISRAIKNRGAIFGRRGAAAAVRSEAEDERPVPGREQSHPLRHFIFSRFNGLLRSPFSISKLLPNSGDLRGRFTICGMRFVAAFIAEIAIRESRNATRAAGRRRVGAIYT
jgi:hypothetical protein